MFESLCLKITLVAVKHGSIEGVSLTIRRLTQAEFLVFVPSFVDLYIEAMDYDISTRPAHLNRWRGDVTQPGFTAIAALAPNGVVGVAYGFLGRPNYWWDSQLRRGLHAAKVDEEKQRSILTSYFEIAEIHVSPSLQGQGIGRNLLVELLWNIPENWAILSTPEVEAESNAAFGLYRSMGFEDIVRHHLYPGDSRPFAILGRPLPLD